MIETGFNFYFDSNIEKIFGCKVPLFKNDRFRLSELTLMRVQSYLQNVKKGLKVTIGGMRLLLQIHCECMFDCSFWE